MGVKIIPANVFEAMRACEAANAALAQQNQRKLYSKLKIIRALGDEWETYKTQLSEAGYLDQFLAAEYMASDDPVFQAFLQLVPDDTKAMLEQCLYEQN